MSLKLGELLLSEKIITQAQLDEALKCHIIFGIKLGSSLIELGLVKEDVLVNLLSRKLGVPAVSNAELMNVPISVLDRLSAAVAEKFRVVPVRLENKRLHVAMSDPTDLTSLEELSFITGNRVLPMIAAEIQVLRALEKHYGIARDHRYVWATSNLQKDRDKEALDLVQGLMLNEQNFDSEAEPEASSPFKDLLHVPVLTGLKDSVQIEVEGINEADSDEIYTIDSLSLDFAAAKNRDDIADVFIRYLGQKFSKCALLTIRGHGAVGWRGVVHEQLVGDFESVAFEISKSSELSEILIGKHYFFGPLSDTPANHPLMVALKLCASDTVLSLPVIMNNRVVAMIIVSSDVIHLQQLVEELRRLVYKASLAFQILVLRNKLLQT